MWPPALTELKDDMKIDVSDTRDDTRLQRNLDAAVAFVQRVRPKFNYTADPVSPYKDPTFDIRLGALRLAARWNTRPRSPDGLVQMGELGASRVTSFDPDIDRLLRIGRHAYPVVG